MRLEDKAQRRGIWEAFLCCLMFFTLLSGCSFSISPASPYLTPIMVRVMLGTICWAYTTSGHHTLPTSISYFPQQLFKAVSKWQKPLLRKEFTDPHNWKKARGGLIAGRCQKFAFLHLSTSLCGNFIGRKILLSWWQYGCQQHQTDTAPGSPPL